MSIQLQTVLNALVEGNSLSEAQMTAAMDTVMAGDATPAQIGALLLGLRMKGETVAEITAAARVIRKLAQPVSVTVAHLVDTCGTGGDGCHTFNISTAAAFVAASAGACVAKHGNRAVSSRVGSADILELAGVQIDLEPDLVARCIEQIGVGFMFAPRHHGAMRFAAGPRRELGLRTIFNLLGPLTNPAGAPCQVVGVYARKLIEPVAEVLRNLGSRHVLVVHADDGLDEISVCATTHIAELLNGDIRVYSVTPETLGLRKATPQDLRAETGEQSLGLIHEALSGKAGPALDIVLANAGAAIYAADICGNLREGIEAARLAVSSGAALAKLQALVSLTRDLKHSVAD